MGTYTLRTKKFDDNGKLSLASCEFASGARISVGEMKEDAMDLRFGRRPKKESRTGKLLGVRDVPAGTLNVLQWHAVIWEKPLMFTVVVKI